MNFTRFCRCGIVWTLLAVVVDVGGWLAGMWATLLAVVVAGGGWLAGTWAIVLAAHSIVGLVAGQSGRRHKFVVGSLPPLRTMSVPSKMRHSIASNTTVYPASQNFAVATNEEWVRPGMMCACVVLPRIHGMSRLHVCVGVWIVLFYHLGG